MREFLVFLMTSSFIISMILMYLKLFGKQDYFSGFNNKSSGAGTVVNVLAILFTTGVLPLLISGFCLLLLILF